MRDFSVEVKLLIKNRMKTSLSLIIRQKGSTQMSVLWPATYVNSPYASVSF